MKEIEKIKARARAWRNTAWHDKAFCLQVFMHGDISAIQEGRALDQYAVNRHTNEDLPDYGEINLDLGPMGIQNHGEINSRINIQGLVHVKPVITLATDDPILKQTNTAWWRSSWDEGDWSSQYYLTGMETEANGIGCCEYTVEADGRIACYQRPMLDTIWDRMYPSPVHWRGVFNRKRLDLDEALEKYGHLYDKKTLKGLATEMFPAKQPQTGRRQYEEEKTSVIHEWIYQDPEHFCIFLGGIQNKNAKYVGYGDNLELVNLGTEASINPNRIIPYAWWVDSYLPSNNSPRSKQETIIRLATMLNELENYMVKIIKGGLPLTGIAGAKVGGTALLEQIKNMEGSKDLNRILILEGVSDIRELFSRLSAEAIPEAVITLRGILKEELNAATGVMDMQRGQELSRDRVTRYEVSTLKSMQGVQARHLRERYARFLEQGFQISRLLGAMWDDRPRILNMENGSINTGKFPINVHLAVPLVGQCDPETMYYLSEDEKRQRAIEEFQAIKIKAIELGVADPYRTMARIYQQIGYKDPVAEGLLTPAEFQMMQEQMALAQAAGIGQEQDGSNPNSGSGSGGGSQSSGKQNPGS